MNTKPDFIRIDMDAYPRREHFRYFCGMAYPYVGTTVQVDVTDFVSGTKAAGYPFFLSFVWCAAQAANAVPELRRRVDGDGIIEFPYCPTSNTVARPDGTYCYCSMDCQAPLRTFLPYARACQQEARERGSIKEEAYTVQPLLFVSCVPWFSYTALIQPVPYPADSNPRITWGKYEKQGDRLMMPVTLLCHHGLVDGLHIAQLYENLKRTLAECLRD